MTTALTDTSSPELLHSINASKSGNFEIVNVLLDANADPNVCNILGNSPLMKASKMGHDHIVKKLLQKDADVNKEDIGG